MNQGNECHHFSRHTSCLWRLYENSNNQPDKHIFFVINRKRKKLLVGKLYFFYLHHHHQPLSNFFSGLHSLNNVQQRVESSTLKSFEKNTYSGNQKWREMGCIDFLRGAYFSHIIFNCCLSYHQLYLEIKVIFFFVTLFVFFIIYLEWMKRTQNSVL